MSRVRGRAFKITRNQAKGYGYAKPAYRRNPGVTTIAAINGRGSYAGSRSARSVMSKLKQNARKPAARRALTTAQKNAFKRRMSMARNRSATSTQRAASRKNIRKAQSARKAWGRKLPRGRRVRVGRATYGRKPKARRLKAGVYVANRRKKAGSKTMARRRRKSATGATKKRRRSSKRRRKSTTKSAAAPKRRRRRKSSRKAAGSKRRTRRVARRRRKTTRKAVAGRRKSRRSKRRASPRRRRRSKAASPRRRRRARKGAARRKSRRSKSAAPRRRRRSRKLKANGRKRRSHRRNRSTGRRRKSHRRNRRTGLKANRRRRHRRNGRSLFRRNGAKDFLKMGAVLFMGFGLHRLLTNLVDRQVLSRLLPAPAAPVATSGFGLQENRGLIASIVVGAGAAVLANKLVKNAETKKLIIGGIAVSTVQGVIMSLLKAFAPAGADMLAGPEDGTAARISAMYGLRGLGAGASIMPRYAAIGEYFREPMNGMGEYFREPMNGVGEYIAATAGLGTYENNGDLYQAAAGMGNHDYNGNHIDPSGDLDRQLTIAEAAAGVGALSPFEAAAGIGPMEAAAGMRGFGAIDTVPSGDTWIPGSVNPQLWAGVRAVDQGQSATEMVPAGVLQTDGGQGIFG